MITITGGQPVVVTEDGVEKELMYNSNTIDDISAILDATLSMQNKAADAKSVGDVLGTEYDENICTNAESGYYYVAWNNGDIITKTANASYGCGEIVLGDAEYITFNENWIGPSFSFFADADNKRIAKISDCQTSDAGRVYAVPSGAVKAFVSQNISSMSSAWSQKGIVCFSGKQNIVFDIYTSTAFPYGEKVYRYDNVSRIYHVEKDGSGDYTSFVDCIREATKYFNSVVYVGAGVFDILDELGADYLSGVSSTQIGLILMNRVHVIGTSQTILKMNYTGSSTNVKTYLSPLNSGPYGFTIENMTIEDSGVRYSFHDDMGIEGNTPYTNKFINCRMIHKSGTYSDCIGGGLGQNGYIEIRGCYFEGESTDIRLVYYHGNNKQGVTDAIGRIEVHDNYFADLGTFQLTNYGDSTKVSTAFVSNNSFGTAPSVNDGSYPTPVIENMQLIDWNNVVRT